MADVEMKNKHPLRSRRFLSLVSVLMSILLLVITAGCGKEPSVQAKGEGSSNQGNVVRIGYQKFGTLSLLKAEGTLEKRLKASGFSVQWTEFPGGPQLLEALNVGSIDLGHTGEAPPIFAQAAGAPLVYVANEPPDPIGEAVLVPKNSPIKTFADLKGKKIALNKGSNVHYLLVKALEAYGLKYSDIQPVYLPPSDARAAFQQGSVDAWVIWEPFLSAAQRATGARILLDGHGLVQNREFILSSASFAKQHQDIINSILDELRKADKEANADHKKVAEFLSPQVGIDVPSLEQALSHRKFGVQPLTEQVITDQQHIADTFYTLNLIPKAINVKEALLQNQK